LLKDLFGQVAGCFPRRETRQAASQMVDGLLMELEDYNCWSIAEAAGHRGPYRLQHLLSRAVWDDQQVLNAAAAWAVAQLDDGDAVLVVGGTADEKSSADAVGAARSSGSSRTSAHGRKYHSEARELARSAAGDQVSCLGELTTALLEEFLVSRPRPHPRSFNHLLGVVRCLLDWAVTWGLLQASPLQARRRRVTEQRIPFLFDPAQARRLLDAAAALPDGPRAPARGPAYHAIFALCYGLGLRAGEACGLRLGDVDAAARCCSCEAASSARAAWSRTGRGSPHWSASTPPAAPAPQGWTPRRRCSLLTGEDPSIPAPPARPSIASWPPSTCRAQNGDNLNVHLRAFTTAQAWLSLGSSLARPRRANPAAATRSAAGGAPSGPRPGLPPGDFRRTWVMFARTQRSLSARATATR
jgi:integrase